MSKMVVMRSREKGKQEQSRSALQPEHDTAFESPWYNIANRRTTSARHGPQEMMVRSPDGCQATAVRLAFFNQTLLSWKAAPPIGATASAPVRVLMPRPPIWSRFG